MVSSAKLALFAFLQSVGSISLGRKLRAFILRCLLLWPRILCSLRKAWSRYFQTSSADEKKTKGDTGGPSSAETLQKREDCVVVCASRDLGGGGEPSRHTILGSNDAEQSIPLEHVTPRTPSVPHSPSSSSAPSPRGSPRLSASRPPFGSPHSSASSLGVGNTHGAMEFFIQRSNSPVSWTHSRATSRQFIGAPPRSHSRPSSPFRLHLSRPGAPVTHDIETRHSPIQHSQDSFEGSTSEVSIQFERPSRSASPEDAENVYSAPRLRLPPAHGPTQSFPTHHQPPSSESANSSAVSSPSRGPSPSRYRVPISTHQSGGTIQDSMTSQSIQARIPFPQPFTPRVSTPISTTNASSDPSRPDTPPVRPMHPDQVSRYMKKGDV